MILHHGVGQTSGFFSETERSLALNPVKTRNRGVWLPWTTWGKGQYLGNAIVCHYGGNESGYRAITLWHVARPKIDPALTLEQVYRGNVRELVADVAITGNCPGTWGDALTFVWGEDAWNRLRNSPQAKQSLAEAEQFEKASLEERRRWEAQKAEAWAKLSEKDRCLIRMGVHEPKGKLTPLGEFWASFCANK
jgi:hypothetical protein